MDEYVALVE